MRRVLTNILVILVSVTGLEAARPNNTHPDQIIDKTNPAPRPISKLQKPYQVGTASWYGRHFHGKPTASGEPFNMYQFTAAHRRLPLGTIVRVTNMESGESVIVRVNDRGPMPKSRIIDLSYGAARMIGLGGPGLETVRLDIVEPPTEIAQSAALLP